MGLMTYWDLLIFQDPKRELSELNESAEETTPKSSKIPVKDVESVGSFDGNINYYSRRIVCINGQCEVTVCINGKCKKETKNSSQ